MYVNRVLQPRSPGDAHVWRAEKVAAATGLIALMSAPVLWIAPRVPAVRGFPHLADDSCRL